MCVFRHVVAKTHSGDELLALAPFAVEKPVGPKARPEKSAAARPQGQRAIPLGVDDIRVASRYVGARVPEFMLLVHLRAHRILANGQHAARIAARPMPIAAR